MLLIHCIYKDKKTLTLSPVWNFIGASFPVYGFLGYKIHPKVLCGLLMKIWTHHFDNFMNFLFTEGIILSVTISRNKYSFLFITLLLGTIQLKLVNSILAPNVTKSRFYLILTVAFIAL